MKFNITESLDDVQFGVHQFSTESIIFRGSEEECIKYIDERPELWDDAEVYMIYSDDPHYLREANNDQIELEYDDLTFTQYGNQRDVDDWDEFEYTRNWKFKVDQDDLYTYIFEDCIDVEDFPDAFESEFNPNNEADWNKFTTWLDNNYDEIFAKYKDKILNHYEEKAAEDAAEKYDDYDYHIDPDWGPGSHHDIDLDESINEASYADNFGLVAQITDPRYNSHRYITADFKLTANPDSAKKFATYRPDVEEFIERFFDTVYLPEGIDYTSDILTVAEARKQYEEDKQKSNNPTKKPSDNIIRVKADNGKVYEYSRIPLEIHRQLKKKGFARDYLGFFTYKLDSGYKIYYKEASNRSWAEIMMIDPEGHYMRETRKVCTSIEEINQCIETYIADYSNHLETVTEAAECKICCICKKPFDEYGNNAEPVCSGTCCDKCNMERVIPMRFKMMNEDVNKELSLAELVNDSINHLVNDLGKDISAEDFADDVVHDIENNYPTVVPENMTSYNRWASEIMCEVSRQLNRENESLNESKELNEGRDDDKMNEILSEEVHEVPDYIYCETYESLPMHSKAKVNNFIKDHTEEIDTNRFQAVIEDAIYPTLYHYELEALIDLLIACGFEEVSDVKLPESLIVKLLSRPGMEDSFKVLISKLPSVKNMLSDPKFKDFAKRKGLNSRMNEDISVQAKDQSDKIDDHKSFNDLYQDDTLNKKVTNNVFDKQIKESSEKNDSQNIIDKACEYILDNNSYNDWVYDVIGDKLIITLWSDDEYGDESETEFTLSIHKLEKLIDDEDAFNSYIDSEEDYDNYSELGDEFYRKAEKELEDKFNCTGAYLEPSTQLGQGIVKLFADDMTFEGEFDFQEGESYIKDSNFEGFLNLCLNSFIPVNDDIDESLDESIDTYTLTYYASTATRERRPETLADIKNDWKVETFQAANDFDAVKHAICVHADCTREDLENDYDIYDMDDAIRYLNDTDWGDGSPIIIKLESLDGIIYDTGCTYEQFVDDYHESQKYMNNLIKKMEEIDPATAEEWRHAMDVWNIPSKDLDEAIDPSKALEVKKTSDADVIFYGYQYKNQKPVILDPPEELSDAEYEDRQRQIVNSFTKLNADKPTGNRYGYDHDIMFYALFNRKNEALDDDMSYDDLEKDLDESIYIKRVNHLFGLK